MIDAASTMENVYHQIMLSECKSEESREWENMRHQIMSESIKDSCNYYGLRNCKHENEEELER